jgi:hypothetical protein
MAGIGLPYSKVLEAVMELCRTRTIQAEFLLESPELSDVEGALEEPGRPETDLKD